MASDPSSSSLTHLSRLRYDVFLSFRDEDTRYNFTSHLFSALSQKRISTFVNVVLTRGEDITSDLMQAIEKSKISVIIFSQNYASSKCCLEELVQIMECKHRYGQIVLPIFYHVDPSDVRKQIGEKYGQAFQIYEQKYTDKVLKWKSTLTEVANIRGWHSTHLRSETELVDQVVKAIMRKVYTSPQTIWDDLVGINSRIEQILQLLSIGSTDVRVVGIWGINGIGKTAISEALLNRISHLFDDHCYLEKVREKSLNNDSVQLKKELLSKLLGDDNLSVEMYKYIVTERLKGKKLVIVLDDVNDPALFDELINRDWLGPGSRVIIVSRDRNVLKHKCDEVYEVKPLSHTHSLELLSLKTFKQKQPSDEYVELANMVVNYAEGIPLAIVVLGSLLYKKSTDEWESILKKLKSSPHPVIKKLLKVSYDELENEEKDIFCDVASVFYGSRIDEVEDVLNGCGFVAKSGITRLIEKCLLTVGDNNTLNMPNLILEIGRDIAQKKGRLGDSKQILKLLTGKDMSEKEAIQALSLNISEIGKVQLPPDAFSEMNSLRLLKFYKKTLDNSGMLKSGRSDYPEFLPSALRLLHWDDYPYKNLPPKFSMENLVELKIRWGNITQLWNGDNQGHNWLWKLSPSWLMKLSYIWFNFVSVYSFGFISNPISPTRTKCLRKLKRLELYQCRQLIRLPDLSSAIELEQIDLNGCESLAEIPSLKCLNNLAHLILCGCKNLKSVPELPKDLQTLDLRDSGVEESSSVLSHGKHALIHFDYYAEY